MSEKVAWDTLREKVFSKRDRADRLENLIGNGFPDVNYCIEGKDGWIELKAPIEPKKPDTFLLTSNHQILQSQKNWFLRQRRAKGHAWFYIETDKRRLLVSGHFADFLNEMTVSQIISISTWMAPRKLVDPSQWLDLRKKLSR